MAKNDSYSADWNGLTAARIVKNHVDQWYRTTKRDKRIRDALAECEDANRPKAIVHLLIRADDSERRRMLDRIREGATAQSVLDTIAAALIDKLGRVGSEASMSAVIRVLVDIGPRVLPVVSRLWQSGPSIKQVLGVVVLLSSLVGKMDTTELSAALVQLKTAKDTIAAVDDRRCQAVNRVELRLLQALQSSPAGA